MYSPATRISCRGHHGLIFSPSFEHEAQPNLWSGASLLSALCGQTQELFIQKGSTILYMGTYRCLSSHDWSEDGVYVPHDIVSLFLQRPFIADNHEPVTRLHSQYPPPAECDRVT